MQPIVRAIQLLTIVTGYITGPIFLFVPIAWWLSRYYDDNRWLYASVGISFICSILLIMFVLPKRLSAFYKNNSSSQ